jgi:hypothetical protein
MRCTQRFWIWIILSPCMFYLIFISASIKKCINIFCNRVKQQNTWAKSDWLLRGWKSFNQTSASNDVKYRIAWAQKFAQTNYDALAQPTDKSHSFTNIARYFFSVSQPHFPCLVGVSGSVYLLLQSFNVWCRWVIYLTNDARLKSYELWNLHVAAYYIISSKLAWAPADRRW